MPDPARTKSAFLRAMALAGALSAGATAVAAQNACFSPAPTTTAPGFEQRSQEVARAWREGRAVPAPAPAPVQTALPATPIPVQPLLPLPPLQPLQPRRTTASNLAGAISGMAGVISAVRGGGGGGGGGANFDATR